MPKRNSFYFAKIVVGVGILCFGASLHTLVSQHEQSATSRDDEYLDHLLHLRHPPLPPLPAYRKLSHVITRHNPRHVQLYDLQAMPPGRTYHCITAKTLPRFHICVYPSDKDKYISAALVSDGIWEPYITTLLQRAFNKYPDAYFIDVGANIGYYTLLAAQMGHHVIAVEPAYENIVRLHKGVALNKLQHNVHLVFNAVSDSHENVTLTENKDNQGGIWIQRISQEKQQSLSLKPGHKVVMTTTMDHLLEVAYFAEAVIKIDIEGYECRALAGARRLLTKVHVPYIFMEWKKMYTALHDPHGPCPVAAVEDLTNFLVDNQYIPYEVRTGFQLNPQRSTTRWRIGDIYWRHQTAKLLQNPF